MWFGVGIFVGDGSKVVLFLIEGLWILGLSLLWVVMGIFLGFVYRFIEVLFKF